METNGDDFPVESLGDEATQHPQSSRCADHGDPETTSASALQYDTPDSLSEMEARDLEKLEERIYEALVQVREDWMIDAQPTHRVHPEPFDAGSAACC